MTRCLIVALSLALASCAASSPRIDTARFSELQKGRSTVAEVVGKFGRPSVLSKNPDGTQTAIYVHDDGQSMAMIPLVATMPVDSSTFYFDGGGVLTDFKIKLVHAEKTAPADTTKSMQSTSEKPDSPATTKTTPGNSNSWSFRGLLPSSTTGNR